MNNYAWFQPRKRNKNLLIVEGNHEKNELISILLKVYPRIDIEMNDIVIYHTNIYQLYDEIVKEYDEEWDKDDIDLPLIVGRKIKCSEDMSKDNFKNILIVFDYERHDTHFSEEKISRLQAYFNDSTNQGKLYINYPMVESYQHLISLSDESFAERSVSVLLRPGSQYKDMVRKESCIAFKMEFPNKIKDILSDRFQIKDEKQCDMLVEQILKIESIEEDLVVQVKRILENYIVGKDLSTASNQMKDIITKCGYVHERKSYYEYMRSIFSKIIIHNICKSNRIQEGKFNVPKENLKECFEALDFKKILEIQNERSRDDQAGMIWVLNTFVLFVPEYNFSLIE